MRLKTALFLTLLAAAPGTTQAPAQPGDSAKLCAQIPPLAEQLTKISGMPLRHAVPCDFITKEKIKEFLFRSIKEVAKPEDLRAEELTLKKFGLVPRDFDLAKNTIELLTEQAAAFYDYDRKKLFVTDTTASETQEPVLSHEIAHAIADQNYNLSKFIKAGRKSDDGATARLAAMEGQATWLMSELLARKMGQSLNDSPSLEGTMSGAAGGAAGQGGARVQARAVPVAPSGRPGRWRGGAVPGLRPIAALPAPDAGFPVYQGHALPACGFRARRPGRIRRGLSQAPRLHPTNPPSGEILQRRQTYPAVTAAAPPSQGLQEPGRRIARRTGARHHAGTVFRQGSRRRTRAALARLRLPPGGEQESRPHRAALRRGVG